MGIAYKSQWLYQQTIAFHQQSLDIVREIGDRNSEGKSLTNLGIAYNSQGRYQQAIAFHQQSLEIAREIGDRSYRFPLLAQKRSQVFSLFTGINSHITSEVLPTIQLSISILELTALSLR
ncbi:tetratricopeptide repeat protein [Nostoc punctiforme UO1]|uniref:tetratricopeptide repeat protein n=1 Tax=Nostoc punctiforme TaxID=272131 RepID=UPI0030AC407F